ncbi:MAG: hypothetical protein LBS27_00380 [Bifidobacteriaceae bacterium]|jgi:hypothetical protein|nr:hypothetical protein [Bifidobacteriaceae bacterium]
MLHLTSTQSGHLTLDPKKKDLAEEFKNAGREWAARSAAPRVGVHDFPGLGRANPCDVYGFTRPPGARRHRLNALAPAAPSAAQRPRRRSRTA